MIVKPRCNWTNTSGPTVSLSLTLTSHSHPHISHLTLTSQVHQKQTERMRARSDWFLSDWPASGNSGLVTYRAVARPDRVLSPRPTSLLSPSHLSSHLSSQPSSHHSTPTKLPHTGSGGCLLEPDVVTGKPPGGQVALRRKLSDKDKERRLVRRSSSKRKDKENGGGGEKCGSQVRVRPRAGSVRRC